MIHDDEFYREIHQEIDPVFQNRNLKITHILAYLSLSFSGSLEMHGYSEDFAEKTFNRMLEKFKSLRKERLKREKTALISESRH